jgi:ribosomal protein S18 acetylase RimI-like enzyme
VSTGPTVRFAMPADAAEIAALHAEQISEGFIVHLGTPFLAQLYRRVASGDGSFALVSSDAHGGIAGFVAVAESTGRLYRDFLVHDGLRAGWRALPAIVRHPGKVVETLRHGIGGGAEREGAEILALAVAGQARGQGTGRALVTAATSELRRRGVTRAHVVTLPTNEPARRTYLGCGFEPDATIEVHRGTVQEVLVWRA